MTVYGALGAPGFRRLAEAMHERCLAEPEISHAFTHADLNPRHVERLGDYWAEVFGGPPSGVDHVAMVRLHAQPGVPDGWGGRFRACFVAALDDAAVPESVRPALLAYLDDAIPEVTAYAHPDDVPDDLVAPRRT